MKAMRRDTTAAKRTNNHQGTEMLLFLVVSAIGVYALGNGETGLFKHGLTGLFVPGINLLWLAIAITAVMILFAQMGRVHDTWPSRKTQRRQVQPATPDVWTNERARQGKETEA